MRRERRIPSPGEKILTDDKLHKLLDHAASRGLKELDLSYNGLTTLPPEIRRLTNIESLDLSGNELIAVPQEIGYLSQLKHLDLRRNLLTGLPAELGSLSGLSTLDVRQNRLTTLPRELENLHKIKITGSAAKLHTSVSSSYLGDGKVGRTPYLAQSYGCRTHGNKRVKKPDTREYGWKCNDRDSYGDMESGEFTAPDC